MKRTLHLTVMMLLAIIASVNRAYAQEEERVVLYETDFSDGLVGWKCPSGFSYISNLGYILGSASTSSTEMSKFYRTINTDGKYYKDIEITWEMTPSLSNIGVSEIYPYVGGKVGLWKLTSTDSVYRYDIPRKNFQVGLAIYLYNNTGSRYKTVSASVKIRKMKVTGVLFKENLQPESEISDMSQVPNLPEESIVKVNFEDATVLTRHNGTVILFDKEKGGLVINDSTAIRDIPVTDEGAMGMPYVVSGSVTGIHLTRNGSSELFCPEYNIELSENQEVAQLYPHQIEYDDYYNHIGEFVAIPSISDIDLWDRTGWLYGEDCKTRTETSHNSWNYWVSGVVFPYKNGGNLRFIELSLVGSYTGINERHENDYQALKGKNIGYIRLVKKDNWYTLCLPFDLPTAYNKGTYAKFDGSNDGILTFRTETCDTIFAGTPFMYKPESDRYWPFWGKVVIDNGNPVYDSHGDYSFVGMLDPGVAGNRNYYLAAGNTIKPFVPGSLMKAFHAYFVPHTPNAALARSICIDGMTTAINDIEWGDGNPFISPTDNRIYNLEGQMVGNDLEMLPKGIYIVNGKKVLK